MLDAEERTRKDAKSILLTEDNLNPIQKDSPDLIQGLPDFSKLNEDKAVDSVVKAQDEIDEECDSTKDNLAAEEEDNRTKDEHSTLTR